VFTDVCVGKQLTIIIPNSARRHVIQPNELAWVEIEHPTSKSEHSLGDAMALRKRILAVTVANTPHLAEGPRYASVLRCLANITESMCDVSLSDAVVLSRAGSTATIRLSLTSEVAQLPAATHAELKQFLAIAGTNCNSFTGSWVDGSHLHVECATSGEEPMLEGAVMRLLHAPQLTTSHESVGAQDEFAVAIVPNVVGSVHIRECRMQLDASAWDTNWESCISALQSEPGTALPSGCVCSSQGVAFPATVLDVVECPVDASIKLNAENEERLLPALQNNGVLAVGNKGWHIPHKDLPAGAQNGGSWGFCMWFWLFAGSREDPTLQSMDSPHPPFGEQHRVLFFKGPAGLSQQRTPSAWLSSSSNKLVMRVSESFPSESPDVGGESNSEIPVQRWVHLCFSMSNHSQHAPNHHAFEFSMFMDTRLDTAITFQEPVVIAANEGPLSIGKHAEFAGTSALISDFSIYDGYVGKEGVAQHYQRYCHLLVSQPSALCRRASANSHRSLMLEGVVRASTLFFHVEPSKQWVNRLFDEDNLITQTPCRGVHKSAIDTSCFSRWEYVMLQAQHEILEAQRANSLLALGSLRTSLFESSTGTSTPANFESCNVDMATAACADAEGSCDRLREQQLLALHDLSANGYGNDEASNALASWLLNPGRDQCIEQFDADLQVVREDFRSSTCIRAQTLSDAVSAEFLSVMGKRPKQIAELEDCATANFGRSHAKGIQLLIRSSLQASARSLFDLAMVILLYPGGVGVTQINNSIPLVHECAFALGLAHMAAMLGDPRAWAFLGHRYDAGDKLPCQTIEAVRQSWSPITEQVRMETLWITDVTAASMYYEWAADVAEIVYVTPGSQPRYEYNRLNSAADDVTAVEHAQRGTNDDVTVFHMMRANAGEVAHMQTIANYFYWGTNGVPRDHTIAFEWWDRAAAAGDTASAVAAAGMLVRGEVVDANLTRARELYEFAAESDNTNALNGLGYAYFNGLMGVELNRTRAFEYFQRAAEQIPSSGDPLINAAHCLLHGAGTPKNLKRGYMYLVRAALDHEHFAAGLQVGRLLARGGQPAFCQTPECENDTFGRSEHHLAMTWFRRASQYGEWAALTRRGFERYMRFDYHGAFFRYFVATMMGQEVAATNAGWLLMKELTSVGDKEHSRRMTLFMFATALRRGNADALLPLADMLLYQSNNSIYHDLSFSLFARACALGQNHGCTELAFALERTCHSAACHPIITEYYKRVLQNSPAAVLMQFPFQTAYSSFDTNLAEVALAARNCAAAAVEIVEQLEETCRRVMTAVRSNEATHIPLQLLIVLLVMTATRWWRLRA
jgi:TPR repeat protein